MNTLTEWQRHGDTNKRIPAHRYRCGTRFLKLGSGPMGDKPGMVCKSIDTYDPYPNIWVIVDCDPGSVWGPYSSRLLVLEE